MSQSVRHGSVSLPVQEDHFLRKLAVLQEKYRQSGLLLASEKLPEWIDGVLSRASLPTCGVGSLLYKEMALRCFAAALSEMNERVSRGQGA